MHETLLGQELVFGLHMPLIRHTTVYRTYGCALGLLMKAHALCTFIRGDIVNFIADGLLNGIGIHLLSIRQDYLSI
jgi:hypothetical protein